MEEQSLLFLISLFIIFQVLHREQKKVQLTPGLWVIGNVKLWGPHDGNYRFKLCSSQTINMWQHWRITLNGKQLHFVWQNQFFVHVTRSRVNIRQRNFFTKIKHLIRFLWQNELKFPEKQQKSTHFGQSNSFCLII